MNRNTRNNLILSTIVCLMPIIAGLLLYDRLPEQVAIHFDAAGNPNSYSSRLVAVVVLPAILALLNLAMPAILKMDPKYKNTDSKVRALVQWIIPAVSIFASTFMLSAALGKTLKAQLYVCIFMGILFTATGCFMPRMKQSYTIGIKLPWTLDDEENWDKTHLLAGRLWTIGGLCILACAFLPVPMSVTVGIILAMVLVPAVYSYLLYSKKHKG